MSMIALLWFLLIGLVAGWLASRIMGGGRQGVLVYMVVGVIGAILGGWLFRLLGIYTRGMLGSLITALVGAIVLIALLRAIRKA
jgi:uncharacterized membrane protein YeaQ/YmgE (transglycosylase-associated protein family)